ncbi:hypothetical protein V6Z11_D07G164200 [Gossypium hirsutum]
MGPEIIRSTCYKNHTPLVPGNIKHTIPLTTKSRICHYIRFPQNITRFNIPKNACQVPRSCCIITAPFDSINCIRFNQYSHLVLPVPVLKKFQLATLIANNFVFSIYF